MRHLGFIPGPHHASALRFGADLRVADEPKPNINWHEKMSLVPVDALGNDRVGNCVPAGSWRGTQMRMANAMGSSWKPTADLALATYGAWTGWNATTGQPDIGTPLAVAQAQLAQTGLAIPEIQELDVVLPVAVDPLNVSHIKLACEWFGGVWFALNMPAEWQDGRTTWDVAGAAGGWGPHFVPCGKYEQSGAFYPITWGEEVTLTMSALLKYCISCGAGLSRAWLETTGRSPAGLDYDATLAKMGAVG